MASLTAALALSYAAIESASLEAPAAAEMAHAETLMADFGRTAPFEYFPGRYQNQGREIEPVPPQF
jgi:hypothetical protein